jgi:hypothetical protein
MKPVRASQMPLEVVKVSEPGAAYCDDCPVPGSHVAAFCLCRWYARYHEPNGNRLD